MSAHLISYYQLLLVWLKKKEKESDIPPNVSTLVSTKNEEKRQRKTKMCLTELQSQDTFNLRAVALQSPDQEHGFNNRQLLPGFAYNSFPYFHFYSLWTMVFNMGWSSRWQNWQYKQQEAVNGQKHHHRHTLKNPVCTFLCTKVIVTLYVTTCTCVENNSDHR